MDVNFAAFDALTFDCYGTLIDWERGITAALHDLWRSSAADRERPSDESLLEDFGRFESEEEKGDFRPYRRVLESVAGRFGEAHGFTVSGEAAGLFAASVGDWPPFSDTVDALGRLASRFRVAIVSNVDDDLFRRSARKLEVPFAEVVTAEQVGSYKPARGHFDEVVRRLDLPKDRILHVAQSLYHDIGPAAELGFTTVWVNRRAGRDGGGATPASRATPDLEVPDLATLADLAVPAE